MRDNCFRQGGSCDGGELEATTRGRRQYLARLKMSVIVDITDAIEKDIFF